MGEERRRGSGGVQRREEPRTETGRAFICTPLLLIGVAQDFLWGMDVSQLSLQSLLCGCWYAQHLLHISDRHPDTHKQIYLYQNTHNRPLSEIAMSR